MKAVCKIGLALVVGLSGSVPLALAAVESGSDSTAPTPGNGTERLAAFAPGAASGVIDPAKLPSGGRPDLTAPRPDPGLPSGALVSAKVVNEGFALIDRPDAIFAHNWIRQNNSDHPWLMWQQGTTNAFLAEDGAPETYIASHPFSTLANAGTISSWLLTPPINFSAGTTVSFYTRTVLGSQWPTRMQVRACASGACADVGVKPEDVGDFQTVLLDINPIESAGGYSEQWTQYVLTAANGLPTSGTGRIAFRHHVHQGDGVLRGDWTALDRVVVEQGQGETSALDMNVTVSAVDPANPTACGTATALDVAAGDQVNFCYLVTNHTNKTLRYQSLRDDQVGPILTQQPINLAPGASYQHNRVLTVSQSIAPSATWSAQADSPIGYVVDDTQPLAWIDATDGTLQTTPKITFPADFNFRLFGDRIDELCTNWGLVTNNRDYYGSCPAMDNRGLLPLPDPNLSPFANAMAMYETAMGGGGGVYFKTLGAAPNRRFVIEFYHMPVSGGSTDPLLGLTAEVILNEGTGVIEYQYNYLRFGGNPACAYGGCAGVGLQNKNLGAQYSFLTQSLRNVSHIVWTPSDPNVYTRTRQVQITAHVPRQQLDAARIDASAPVGGQATAHLSIGNLGDGRLDWTAGTAPTNSHMPTSPRLVLPLHASTDTPFAMPATANPQLPHDPAPRSSSGVQKTLAPSATQSLWAFDIWGGYLLSADPTAPSYMTGTVSVRGYPGARTITGADFLDDDFSTLYAFDAATHQLLRYAPITLANGVFAQEQVIGTVDFPTAVTPSGLKQDPTSGVVYLATSTGQGSQLWTIDPITVAVTLVAPISNAPGIVSIDFDNDGNLYGVDVVLDTLFAIDKARGDAVAVGSLGFSTEGAISALAADPADDNAMYLATFTQLAVNNRPDGGFWRVDKATGQATFINAIIGSDGGWAQFGAMSFARPRNHCVNLASVPWLSLSQTAGTLQPGAAATDLSLQLNAGALSDGVYSANLCIHSNDPMQRRTALPITFTVGIGDRLFANGFEATAP